MDYFLSQFAMVLFCRDFSHHAKSMMSFGLENGFFSSCSQGSGGNSPVLLGALSEEE